MNESRIVVPPLDIAKIVKELESRRDKVNEELKKLEEAKKVSAETMRRVFRGVI